MRKQWHLIDSVGLLYYGEHVYYMQAIISKKEHNRSCLDQTQISNIFGNKQTNDHEQVACKAEWY